MAICLIILVTIFYCKFYLKILMITTRLKPNAPVYVIVYLPVL
jgi:hypothetical protein